MLVADLYSRRVIEALRAQRSDESIHEFDLLSDEVLDECIEHELARDFGHLAQTDEVAKTIEELLGEPVPPHHFKDRLEEMSVELEL